MGDGGNAGEAEMAGSNGSHRIPKIFTNPTSKSKNQAVNSQSDDFSTRLNRAEIWRRLLLPLGCPAIRGCYGDNRYPAVPKVWRSNHIIHHASDAIQPDNKQTYFTPLANSFLLFLLRLRSEKCSVIRTLPPGNTGN